MIDIYIGLVLGGVLWILFFGILIARHEATCFPFALGKTVFCIDADNMIKPMIFSGIVFEFDGRIYYQLFDYNDHSSDDRYLVRIDLWFEEIFSSEKKAQKFLIRRGSSDD